MTPDIKRRIASDGYALHYRHWVPAESPRGWLLTLHGIQSHSGWYEYSGSHFHAAGWNVRIPDRRGSGLNAEQRGDAVHWQRLLYDVKHFLLDIREERQRTGSDAPVVISGISWGGKLALVAANEFPELIDGLVLITPGIFSRIVPSLFNRGRIALARSLDLRDRRIPIPLNDPELFTSVPQQQAFIRNDPLALHDMTLSFLYASMDLDEMAPNVPTLKMPVQLMLAEQDRIIDNQRTRQLIQRIAPHADVKTYAGVRHTLELENCRDEFVNDWLNWAQQVGSAVRTSL
ncbi:alpha/beta hydrolase [Planctomicrobium sp. SH661]|uniref:alpha/beta hydrolase n=1 Tax=Planctomicrobium sp. SH661 TaxID=3448124 RepID=UPI003F5B3C31